MAVTDPDAPPHKRASMFIVPTDAPGVNIVRDVPTMEHPQERFGRFNGHSEIYYEDVRLGREALLGEEGEGFLISQHRLVPGRIHHCMRWLGLARRAFDMLCERAVYRPVRGGVLRRQADDSDLDRRLGGRDAGGAADGACTPPGRSTRYGSSAARQDVSLIKFFGAKVLHDVIDRALQIHGALGFSSDMPLEFMYRFARHARFVDGADEVHREVVARQILKGYAPPPDGVPTEHIPTRREESVRRFAAILDAVTAND